MKNGDTNCDGGRSGSSEGAPVCSPVPWLGVGMGGGIRSSERCAGGGTNGGDRRPGWGWGRFGGRSPGTSPRGYGPMPLSGRGRRLWRQDAAGTACGETPQLRFEINKLTKAKNENNEKTENNDGPPAGWDGDAWGDDGWFGR